MTGLPEHAARRNAHRQPRRPDANHWGTDGTRHDGIDPASCERCIRPDEGNTSEPVCD